MSRLAGPWGPLSDRPRRARTLRALAFGTLLGVAALAGARQPDRLRERREILDHEEGRFKRLAATLSRGHAPAPPGAIAPIATLAPGDSSRGFDVLTYDLSLRLDPRVVHLTGRVVIRIAAVVDQVSSVTLDFASGFAVTEVLRGDHAITPTSRGGWTLTLPLDPPLSREERTTLTVAYEGTPGPSLDAGGGLVFWQRDGQPAASTLAEPFDARSFWPSIDDPADRAVVTVHATVPAGFVAASAGVASIRTEPDGWTTWTWRLPQSLPTYLVSVCAARYTEILDSYTSVDGSRTMPVVCYVLPQHAEWNRARCAALKGHIAALAGLFGEYPYLDSKYGIVEGHFSGGMEHPTMTMIGQSQLGNQTRDLTTLLVHELAHQWWGDSVTLKTWDDVWLNEGFATYAEVLYAERVNRQAPGALLTASYDDGRYAGSLAHSVVVPANDPFGYTAAVYDKGAWVLHMLRRVVGDEAFFAALQIWRSRFANGSVTRHDLRSVFETSSGLDLKGFFDQWVETPFRPTLRATYRPSLDGTTVAVRLWQTQPHAVVHPVPGPGDVTHYRFPLAVRLFHPDGTFDDGLLDVRDRDAIYAVSNPGRKAISGLQLDPAGDLLRLVELTGPAL